LPAEVIASHDPQLEKAIEVILDELRMNPPEERKHGQNSNLIPYPMVSIMICGLVRHL